MTANIHRWHARMLARGYRPGLPPDTLLALATSCARREGAILRGCLSESASGLLTTLRRNPARLTHDICETTPEHELSLNHPENVLCLEMAALAFAGRCAPPQALPQWLLRKTYLGRYLQEIGAELRRPKPHQLGHWLHEQPLGEVLLPLEEFRTDLEDRCWPEPSTCASLLHTLESPSSLVSLSPHLYDRHAQLTRITHALAHGGVPGLFITFQFALIDRTQLWCRTKPPRQRGPMQSLCDDLAVPVLRQLGFPSYSHGPCSRRPLHDARRDAIIGRFWRRQGSTWHTSRALDAALIEFAHLADFARATATAM